MFTSESKIPKKNADQKPPTENPSINFAESKIKSAFITKEKIPKVKMFIGSAIKLITGVMKRFMIAKTIAKTKAPKTVTSTLGSR